MCYVKNGYITLDELELLGNAGKSAIKIDIKGDHEVYEKYYGGSSDQHVWRNISQAIKLGMHIEVVNLLVTGVNDDECSVRTMLTIILSSQKMRCRCTLLDISQHINIIGRLQVLTR